MQANTEANRNGPGPWRALTYRKNVDPRNMNTARMAVGWEKSVDGLTAYKESYSRLKVLATEDILYGGVRDGIRACNAGKLDAEAAPSIGRCQS